MKTQHLFSMSMKIWILSQFFLLIINSHIITVEGVEYSSVPVSTGSPPEGNTTFIDGTTWCVGRPGVSQTDLQNALDWACGMGKVDCRPIRPGGACFEPDTLLSHASYAFNYYYQQNGNSNIACNFGGTSTLTKRDPSYGKCSYSASGSSASAALSKYKPRSFTMWRFCGIVMLLYFAS